MPDVQLAGRVRRTESSVANYRHRLKIPKADPKIRLHRVWTERELKLLGRYVKDVRTRRISLKIPNYNPRFFRWTPAAEALVGTAPDEELAKRPGALASTVRARRQWLRIASPHSPPQARSPRAALSRFGSTYGQFPRMEGRCRRRVPGWEREENRHLGAWGLTVRVAKVTSRERTTT